MIESQSNKVEWVISSNATVATGTTTYGYLDTAGFDYAKVMVSTGKQATTSAMATTLSLTEGTNSTAASAIVAFTGGTSVVSGSTGFTIPAFAGTSEASVAVLNVNLGKRERYLRVNVKNTAAAVVPEAVAILSRGEEIPGPDDGSATVTATG